MQILRSAAAIAMVAATSAYASDPAVQAYSPYANTKYPTNVYFGDTHLHTSYSMDAGAFGARLSPADAYRFARGEQVVSNTGIPVRLSRPLDFLAVTDHSDNMGFFPDLLAGNPNILSDPVGRRWHDLIKNGQGREAALDIIDRFSQGTFPKDLFYAPGSAAYQGAWKETIDAAETYNEPGLFTAFIAYEWTSNTGGNNLHRNVIYRDGRDRAMQSEPFTVYPPRGSDNPRDLWKWMTAYEATTGGRVLAIPHNGNLSNGRMFPAIESFTGKPVDREYAEQSAKWERLLEATQTKGDSETHPYLSPTDEFADFQRWDAGNLDGSAAKTKDMLQFEYARSALRNGLKLESTLGVNPYKFGMASGTDSHTALTTAEEDNFFGKTVSAEPGPERIKSPFVVNEKSGVKFMDWQVCASGWTAVWATANTREALWDAMQRKETYSTTGPRMVVRFFGGWDFTADDAIAHATADAGYARGVPMGGDLTPVNGRGDAPTFLVAAMKDSLSGNLDRIQIVKGWLDAAGETHEKIYDVAWGDAERRRPGADGKLPPVGSTVDVKNATWTDTIGDPALSGTWKDPDFDPKLRAFYYARVLEIPTPRWTAYDAKRFGQTPPEGVVLTLQERAYTSPIWYTPGS
jgi:hypothetical protein